MKVAAVGGAVAIAATAGGGGAAAAAPAAEVSSVLAPMSACACTPFTDVAFGSQFATEITWLYNQKISTGWVQPDGTRLYAPLSTVNRDAMAAFMYRLAGSPAFTPPAASPFTDVPVTSQFYKEISWLAAQGISTGWAQPDGTKLFQPLSAVNRDAMAAFMYRLAGSPAFTPPAASPFTDVPATSQFYKEISWLASAGVSMGWVQQDGAKAFQPLSKVNRDAMAAFMYRLNFKVMNPVSVQQPVPQTVFAGQLFHLQVTPTSGVYPYVWTLASGNLPPGITLTNAGQTGASWAALDGTPTTAGTYSAQLKVTDALGKTATATVSLTVNPMAITTTSLPDAAAQTFYGTPLQLEGGTGPVSWKVTSGSLPPGLSLAATGYPDSYLSGSANAMGTFSFTVTATDATGLSASADYTVSISQPPLSLMSRTLQPATVSVPYPSPDWLGSGAGFGPYTYKLTGGSLPAGLTLAQDGTLSGTPTTPGTYSFQLTVTDPANQTAAGDFTITVS